MGAIELDLRLSHRAEKHLEAIYNYIAKDSVEQADKMLLRIATELSRLRLFPYSGRVAQVAGTRELVIARTPYLATYKVRKKHIDVLAILHGAQQWPRI